MRILTALFLAALPMAALAQPLQFGAGNAPAQPATSTPAPPDKPGIVWLQRTPLSVFDMGMLQLSQATTRAARTEKGIERGYAAFVRTERGGTIELSYFTKEGYTPEACGATLRRLRDAMFSPPIDMRVLASEVESYFVPYGPPRPDWPANTGMELLQAVEVSLIMNEGACMMTLISNEINQRDNRAPQPAAPIAQPTAPTAPVKPKAP